MDLRRTKSKYTPEQRLAIIEEYEKGVLTGKEIALIICYLFFFGHHILSVICALSAHTIPRRSTFPNTFCRHRPNPIDWLIHIA